jgi:hypothetical protein
LLRSDIRLTPSDIRFASFGGEYNITEGQLRQGCYEILDSALAFLEDGRLLWTDACCTNREYYKEESYIIAKEMGWRIV